jgi:hypothetical protein
MQADAANQARLERMSAWELVEEAIAQDREAYRRAWLLPEFVPCTNCGD